MACNCNENTNCYHINMGCVVPALANPDAYYTKSEVNEKLEEITISGCCISPEEVDEKIDASLEGYATEQWVLDKHYITGVDLSNYALKEEIPDINGYATEAWVNNQGFLKTHQSLEGYATQTWVQNQGYLTQHQDLSNYALKTEIPDISGLASQTYVDNYTYDKATIDQKVAEGGTFDPTQYYTTTQTDNQITAATSALATAIAQEGYQNASQVNAAITAVTNPINNTLTAHTANTDIHVTVNDKAAWNAKLDAADIEGLFGYSEYDSSTHRINFKNTSTGSVLSFIDASPFIVDGMVQNVEIKNVIIEGDTVQCLVISFNTDAGKQDINIPIAQIFDASNYYTTAQTQSYVQGYTYDKATIDQKVAQGGAFDPTQYYTTAQTYSKTEVDNLIPTVPTNVSDFNNDAGYITSAALSNYYTKTQSDAKYLTQNQASTTYLLKSKIWCGTEAQYNAISKKDSETLYLIHE